MGFSDGGDGHPDVWVVMIVLVWRDDIFCFHTRSMICSLSQTVCVEVYHGVC